MKRFWIIGCGKFGSRATRLLREAYPDAALTVVDPDPGRLRPWHKAAETVLQEGVSFLVQRLKTDSAPDWIIAAAPIHVAYEWILRSAEKVHLEPALLPEKMIAALPNVFHGNDGAVFSSHADFLCPEDCPEPPDRCTVTGVSRRQNLYDRIEDLRPEGWTAAVLKSRMLLPGVGGYSPDSLETLKRRIESVEGYSVIATACRCHGVLHAVRTTRCTLFP